MGFGLIKSARLALVLKPPVLTRLGEISGLKEPGSGNIDESVLLLLFGETMSGRLVLVS